jgi:hypothetical protein
MNLLILVVALVSSPAAAQECGTALDRKTLETLIADQRRELQEVKGSCKQSDDPACARAARDIKTRYRLKRLDLEFPEGFTASKIVPGLVLQNYDSVALPALTHCAVKSYDDRTKSFFQLELQNARALERFGGAGGENLAIRVKLLDVESIDRKTFGVFVFTDKAKREAFEEREPLRATAPICIKPGSAKMTPADYVACFRRYTSDMKSRDIAWDYGISHTCCHFAESILEACGLAPCFTIPRRGGLGHRKGVLEYLDDKSCVRTAYPRP